MNYNSCWPSRFRDEANKIQVVLGGRALRIEHVGSTSVPGLVAKPVIDILLAVSDASNEADYVAPLEAAGYRLRIRESNWYEHRMFTAPNRDVNLHIFSAACPEIGRMVAFRDWLLSNESDRDLYARTKQLLAEQPWKSIQHYANAKTSVIEEIMTRARKLQC